MFWSSTMNSVEFQNINSEVLKFEGDIEQSSESLP